MASRLVRMSQLEATPPPNIRRSHSMETFMVRVYPGTLSDSADYLCVEALKNTTAADIVKVAVQKLLLKHSENYELAETFSSGGQLCKERRLESAENPVRIQLLWPRVSQTSDAHRTEYHFYLRKKEADRKVGTWVEYDSKNSVDNFLSSFLQQPKSKKEYQDLCNLPDLNETTLLKSLESRFHNSNIYTYVGSILISLNPFKFYPIYNPKYVKLYQNRRLGDLPPHIFAIADAAYHTMLHKKQNQCIVISGESGSGKTESTNLLLHHLSALSQRGVHGSGIENTILGGGPVLEAFGNAKTVHNNNSSRFGKFIQVNYKENGMVHGAVVEKYLLEKSRIVSQADYERNYHVFYYLLAGASEPELEAFGLQRTPSNYFYLNQGSLCKCYTLESIDGENIDEAHEFTRLKQSMEMVGFPTDTQRRIFGVLAAVLHLGNIEFKKKADHHHHEAVTVKNVGTVKTISNLLKVKESTLIEALTKKKTTAGGETVVMNYNMQDAVATRDAMAKCLYGSLFDWIVLQINHALLAKKDIKEHQGYSIGVLDIFGFEDFGKNSFEQFCINYANERLHYYFNQHIFKFEQEEYVREGIVWKNIEFIDNTACLDLFSKKPTGLLYLLDEECNFPGATNETLLAKFHAQHQSNSYYEAPQMRENAFSIVHYAGKVKYCIRDFRHKNSDLMRHDLMLVLKNSSQAFVRELVGYDPVAVLRWAIVRAFFRAYFAFLDAGKRHNQSPENKVTAAVRSHGQLQRSQAIQALGEGRASERKNIKYEDWKTRKHVSYHGDLSSDLDLENGRQEEAEDYGNGSMRDNLSGGLKHEDENVMYPNDSIAMRRASKVMIKSRSFKPKVRATKSFRDLKAMKALAGKQYIMPRSSKGKNKPPSVSAQFSYSLSKLMETLNQANPFFIRCIKSNAEKAPCKFDEELVLRQLRYTGMLATVKIRQSGYNYRLTFEEFIHQYKILLPKGLLSSKDDVKRFLQRLDLNSENYQIGKTKVFLRETEKMLLDDALHRAIMERIVHIQRWMRSRLDRQRFLRIRWAVVTIQTVVRGFLARRRYTSIQLQFYACLLIQKVFRGFRLRKKMAVENDSAMVIQKNYRGHLARKRVHGLREQKALALKKEQEELERLRKEEEEETLRQAAEARLKERTAEVPKNETTTPVKEDFDSLEDVTRRRSFPAETYDGAAEVHIKASKYEVLEPAETSSVFMSRSRAYIVRETDSKITSRSETPPRDQTPSPLNLKFKGEEGLMTSSPRILTYDMDDSVPGIPPRSPSYQLSDFEPEVLCSSSMHNVKSPRTITRDPDHSASSLYVDFVMPAERRRLASEDSRQDDSTYSEEVFCAGGHEKLEEARAHVPGETIDLHSSASDEGILTKESSTEELIDKEEPDGRDAHESEESSGILDDSESEIASCESGQKSRGTSFTTPPSTPHSPFTMPTRQPVPHYMPPISPLEEGPVWVRRHLESGPRIVIPKAQHGPQDLEICVTPAIQRAMSIENNLSTMSMNETSTTIIWKEKHIMAPLAKQESITESISESCLAEDERSLTGSVSSSVSSLLPGDEPPPKKLIDMSSLKVEPGAGDLGSSHLSPLNRAKNRLKLFMGEHHVSHQAEEFSMTHSHSHWSGFSTEMEEMRRARLPSVLPMMTKSDSKRRSFRDMMKSSSHIFRHSVSMEETRTLKKSTSEISVTHSKMTKLRSLLEHRTGKKQGKKETEDSDDSPSEDGPSSPSIKEESENLGKSAPVNKKGKENRLSVDDLPQGDKKKHRRKNSKNRQAKKDKKTVESTQPRSSQELEKDDSAVFVENVHELSNLEYFLSNKINALSKDERRETIVDMVYKTAMKEFHEFVITAKASQDKTVKYRFRDLMVKFDAILKARAEEKNIDDAYLVIAGTNAFRLYLDEFKDNKANYVKIEAIKEKKKKKGNRQNEEKKDQRVIEYSGHRYVCVQFGIPQHCESCNHLMWMVEKVLVCQNCQYTIHKKCCIKSIKKCESPRDASDPLKGVQKVFGTPLTQLLGPGEKVPPVIEQLFKAVEVEGLHTVGVYRKPGHAAKIKQLIYLIDTVPDFDTDKFTDYPVNVLTSVMKSFFREMPEPLMTFELYDDYIRAGECADKKERVQLIYSVIQKLPTANLRLLRRLIFHLSKIAAHEAHNRMSASSLAIVFAPGIMRCSRTLPAQQSLEHVPKLNLCLECIIEAQFTRMMDILSDINCLDTATASATDRLNTVRASIRNVTATEEERIDEVSREKQEEQMLTQQIMSMQEEKEMLTIDLPSLEIRNSSSEEDMLSTDDLDQGADDIDHQEELAITFDLPAINAPKDIKHLTKCRVSTPTRRPPKKKKSSMISSPDLQSQSNKTLTDFKQYGEEIIV